MASDPAAEKLRVVLDYVPCDACLRIPGDEQDLYCAICARLHRTVVQKTVRSRVVLVETELPAPEPVSPVELTSPMAAMEPEAAWRPAPEPAAAIETTRVTEPRPEPAEAFIDTIVEDAEPEPAPEKMFPPARKPEPEGDLSDFVTIVRPTRSAPEPAPSWEPVAEEASAVSDLPDVESDDDFGVAGARDDDLVDIPASDPSAWEEVDASEDAESGVPLHDEFVLEPDPDQPPIEEFEPAEAEPAAVEEVQEFEVEFEPEPEPSASAWEPVAAEEEPLVDFEPVPEEEAQPVAEEAPATSVEPPEEVAISHEPQGSEEPMRVGAYTLYRRDAEGGASEYYFSDAEGEEETGARPSALPEGHVVKVKSGTGEPYLQASAQGDLPVGDVEGVGVLYGERLRAAGIERSSDLLSIDPFRLSEETGISEHLLERWKGLAELLAAGLSRQEAEILARAGVAGAEALANAKAKDVLEKVQSYARSMELPLAEEIGLRTVQGWIRKAKKYQPPA
ncbi:MAG TPA: DUF4332 domain-containing protein [Candidatus Thermoplasmatota archaeon]|nr:DUF4332 domain-containing protein [Candidatus Thermoplasmatota archaeon]